MLTEGLFARLFPACPAPKRKAYLPLLIAALNEFGINTRARLAAFVAQVGHESCDFKYMQEIASGAAYEGRRDLGNTQPGDGRRFKGRGPIQITGRTNYQAAARKLALPLLEHPELLAEPANGFRAAGLFWKDHKLNDLSDRLTLAGDKSDLQQFDEITLIINGGQNGRADRRRRYQVARVALAIPQPPHIDTKATELDAPIVAAASQGPTATVESGQLIDSELIGKVTTNATARAAGTTALKRGGLLLGRPLLLLFGALEAGNVYVWAGVIVLVLGLGALIYVERRWIKKGALSLALMIKAKLKGSA